MSDHLVAGEPGREFATRERCFITEIFNDPRVPDVSLARCRVPPGVTTELHSLSVDEIYVIRAGRGCMRVGDGRPFPVKPGDAVTIPAGTAQCITNAGCSDLVFDCICRPRFTAAGYRPLESG